MDDFASQLRSAVAANDAKLARRILRSAAQGLGALFRPSSLGDTPPTPSPQTRHALDSMALAVRRAMLVAARAGSGDMVRTLLDYFPPHHLVNADLGLIDCLLVAAEHRAAGVVRALLERTRVAASSTDAAGLSALHWAANGGDAACVEALLASGADVNAATTSEGRTPLYFAAQCGHTEAVRLLLEAGADVDGASADASPLLVATAQNRAAVVRQLLAVGASPDVAASRRRSTQQRRANKGNGGNAADRTALCLAAFHDFPDIAAALLRAEIPAVVSVGSSSSRGSDHRLSAEEGCEATAKVVGLRGCDRERGFPLLIAAETASERTATVLVAHSVWENLRLAI